MTARPVIRIFEGERFGVLTTTMMVIKLKMTARSPLRIKAGTKKNSFFCIDICPSNNEPEMICKL